MMLVMLFMRVEMGTSGWRRRVGRRWSLGLAPTLPPPLGSGLSGHVLLSLRTPALPTQGRWRGGWSQERVVAGLVAMRACLLFHQGGGAWWRVPVPRTKVATDLTRVAVLVAAALRPTA